jgi:hypothetical protein
MHQRSSNYQPGQRIYGKDRIFHITLAGLLSCMCLNGSDDLTFYTDLL